MDDLSVRRLATQHLEVSRRFFLQLGAAGVAGLATCGHAAEADDGETALAQVVRQLEYLTKAEDFRQFGRGNPAPHTLSPEQRLAVGLDPRTWQLEVIADPDSNARIARPMTREAGTALDWSGLLELAKRKAVRYLKV
ncbi:MAG: hypothetical protein FJ276_29130, partial [Planctomycetes bacterium]|nr:hypothetical protein [Planctomycetota bacterium]